MPDLGIGDAMKFLFAKRRFTTRDKRNWWVPMREYLISGVGRDNVLEAVYDWENIVALGVKSSNPNSGIVEMFTIEWPAASKRRNEGIIKKRLDELIQWHSNGK